MRNGKMKNVAQKIDSEKGMTARSITLTGIMAAAVYMASAFLQIPVPTAIGSTRIHMGNVMCLLSGMVLDPVSGGLAAGIGSMFFDLTNLFPKDRFYRFILRSAKFLFLTQPVFCQILFQILHITDF